MTWAVSRALVQNTTVILLLNLLMKKTRGQSTCIGKDENSDDRGRERTMKKTNPSVHP